MIGRKRVYFCFWGEVMSKHIKILSSAAVVCSFMSISVRGMKNQPQPECKSVVAAKASKAAEVKASENAAQSFFFDGDVAYRSAEVMANAARMNTMSPAYNQQQWDNHGVSARLQQAESIFNKVLWQTQDPYFIGRTYYRMGLLALLKNQEPKIKEDAKICSENTALALNYLKKVFENNKNFNDEQKQQIYQQIMAQAALKIAQNAQTAEDEREYAELALKYGSGTEIEKRAAQILAWMYLKGEGVQRDLLKAQKYALRAGQEEDDEPLVLIIDDIKGQHEIEFAEQYLQKKQYELAEKHIAEGFWTFLQDVPVKPPYFNDRTGYLKYEAWLVARGLLALGKIYSAKQDFENAKFILDKALEAHEIDDAHDKQSIERGNEIAALLKEVEAMLAKQEQQESKVKTGEARGVKRKEPAELKAEGQRPAKKPRVEGQADVTGKAVNEN